MTTCESCGLPIPEAPLDVAAILAREPDGLPTAAIAKRLGRRKADVLVALAAEAEAGRLERRPAAGRSHAQVWRVRPTPEKASGLAQEQRHGPEAARRGFTAAPNGRAAYSASRPGERVQLVALVLLVLLALTLGATAALLVREAGA